MGKYKEYRSTPDSRQTTGTRLNCGGDARRTRKESVARRVEEVGEGGTYSKRKEDLEGGSRVSFTHGGSKTQKKRRQTLKLNNGDQASIVRTCESEKR